MQTAAKAAKARIGQSIPAPVEPMAPPPAPEMPLYDDQRPRAGGPAVNFFADEPVFNAAPASEDPAFASALEGPAEPLPEGAISYDDDFGSNVDDEGIPVWEDVP